MVAHARNQQTSKLLRRALLISCFTFSFLLFWCIISQNVLPYTGLITTSPDDRGILAWFRSFPVDMLQGLWSDYPSDTKIGSRSRSMSRHGHDRTKQAYHYQIAILFHQWRTHKPQRKPSQSYFKSWIRGKPLDLTYYLPEYSQRFFAILGRGPRAFQIGKISVTNP